MTPLEVAQRYFDAWNQRDPAAIMASFVDGGTYSDPAVPQGLTGPAIGEYAGGLFAAFPDASFGIVGTPLSTDGLVIAQWLMRGTNTGSLQGAPPTGRAVALPGADFIQVEGDKVRSVQGYFDRRATEEQLGFQVIVQPYSVGPVSFGYSTRMTSGKRTKPGAFSITWLEARSDQERDQMRDYTRRIYPELAKMPGFIGVVTAAVGRRMITMTAWEDPKSPDQMRAGMHQEAMQRFFGPDLCSAGTTSIWAPHRMNAFWLRCQSCGQMAEYEEPEPRCTCGQPLPAPPPYW